MRIVPSVDDEKPKTKGSSSTVGGDDEVSIASSIATNVGMDEFVGTRITFPVFKTPVIQYLQRAFAAASNGSKALALKQGTGGAATDTAEPDSELEHGNNFVLMPDV